MQYKFTCCGHVYNARPKELDAVGQCPYCRTVNPQTEEVDKLDRVIALGTVSPSILVDKKGVANLGGREKRPWGNFKVLLDTPYTKVKRITVNPNERLSLQYHNHRSEVWTIVNGYGKAQVGSSTKVVKTGSIVEIPKGEQHRVVASEVGMTFIEVQLSDSQNFSEDDIVRIEDDYGRTNDQEN
jgi:mannose-6-phosphate isomerase